MSELPNRFSYRNDGRDNRGVKIEVGHTVAFNLSGELAVGTVDRIVEGTRYKKPHTSYRVKLNHDAVGRWKGEISKVQNSRNMVVINEV